MNEIKTICELALADPAPPLRDGAEALAIARRATVRRDRLRVAGSGVVALAVAGALATPAVAGWRATPPPEGGPGTDTTATQVATAAPTTTPPATPGPPPSAHVAPAHGHKLAAVLKGAVPPGYRVTDVRGLKNDKTVYSRKLRLKPNEQMLGAYAQVEIAAGGREGQLMAVVMYTGRPYPAGDLCSPKLRGYDPGARCEVVTVNGVQIKVTRDHDPGYGEVISAVRYLAGGELWVSSWQGIPEHHPDVNLPPDAVDTKPEDGARRPPLVDPPLSDQQVAELAADPAMLP